MENEERDGVDDVITIDIPDYGQSKGKRFLAHCAVTHLKYLPPDIRQFKYERLTWEMKEWLMEMMDADLLVADDELV